MSCTTLQCHQEPSLLASLTLPCNGYVLHNGNMQQTFLKWLRWIKLEVFEQLVASRANCYYTCSSESSHRGQYGHSASLIWTFIQVTLRIQTMKICFKRPRATQYFDNFNVSLIIQLMTTTYVILVMPSFLFTYTQITFCNIKKVATKCSVKIFSQSFGGCMGIKNLDRQLYFNLGDSISFLTNE